MVAGKHDASDADARAILDFVLGDRGCGGSFFQAQSDPRLGMAKIGQGRFDGPRRAPQLGAVRRSGQFQCYPLLLQHRGDTLAREHARPVEFHARQKRPLL